MDPWKQSPLPAVTCSLKLIGDENRVNACFGVAEEGGVEDRDASSGCMEVSSCESRGPHPTRSGALQH